MIDLAKQASSSHDSFTQSFLAKNSIADFDDLFQKKNHKILANYLSQPEVINFLSRDIKYANFDEKGVVYDSIYEKKFYDLSRLTNLIDIPYRSKENFMLSANGNEVRNFLAKKACEFFIEEHPSILNSNIHLSPVILEKTALVPKENDQCIFTKTEFYKNNADKVKNSSANEHLFLSVTIADLNGATKPMPNAHVALTAVLFDKKNDAIKAIFEIDTAPQPFLDNTVRAIMGGFKRRPESKEPVIPVGISIQCGDNSSDRNCAFHSYNIMSSLLQTLHNKPYFLNHVNELLNDGKIAEIKKDMGFEISKNMPNIFDMEQLKERGAVRQLPLNKITIDSAKDRFAVSSAMIPEILASFCRSHVREL